MIAVDGSFENAAIQFDLEVVGQLSDKFADIGVYLRTEAGISACLGYKAPKLIQGIFPFRRTARSGGGDAEPLDPRNLVSKRERRGARFGYQPVMSAKYFVVEAGAAGKFETASQETACGAFFNGSLQR